MRVELAEPAERDLQQIKTYYALKNPFVAEKIIGRIRHAIDLLIRFPEIGHPVRIGEGRKLPVSQTQYMIIYEVIGSVIFIERILHGSQQWPRMAPSDEEE